MLTDALQRCIHANLYFNLEGYDRSLFLLHRGVDLVFLLKYYDEINATHRFQDFIPEMWCNAENQFRAADEPEVPSYSYEQPNY